MKVLQQPGSHPSRLVLIALSVIVTLAILINATSYFLKSYSPDLAITINPLNTQARVDLLSTRLANETGPDELALLKKITERGIALEPIDARLFAMLGIIEERQNNIERAQQHYRHALKLLPTEIQALIHRFFFSANNGDYVEAVSLADVILRRWRVHWKIIEPYMATLLQNKAAYQEAQIRFSKYRTGKFVLVQSLAKEKAATSIAYRLILDWHKNGVDDLRGPVNYLTRKLISYDQYSEAYRLFFLTLNDEQKKEAGYVFNSSFNLNSTNNKFDWKLVKQSGLSAKFRDQNSKLISKEATTDRVYEFRFLGAPVRFSKVLQFLKLPTSKFNLKIVYSTRDLKTVKPISLALDCGKPHRRLATVEFKSGTNKKNVLQASFEVPVGNCDLQLLRIYNGNFVESWKNRYSGSLFLHEIVVELTGA